MALVRGEQVFSVPSDSFAISASNEGYTLSYSVDQQTWTDADKATPAGENLYVKNSINGLWYKLKGNQSDVVTKY